MKSFMATKPPINSADSRINKRPIYFSMKFLIESPNFHSNAATIKNRNPRAATEAVIKTVKLRAVTPERMVITLYGNGVTPAINTAQAPQLLYLI
jgi:hypothetical protein